jgi:hypothetical protein
MIIKKRKEYVEDAICIDFVSQLEFFERIKKTNGIFLHIPNEIEKVANYKFGSRQKRMGKVSGAPDYVFLMQNKTICIEVKKPKTEASPKGVQSEYQKLFEERCSKFKIPYYVVYSANQGIDTLYKEGFLSD